MRFTAFRAMVLLAAAVVALTLAACSGDDPTEAPPAATADASPGSLVIYSGRSESLVDPIIRQFADVTGIDVQVKYGGTASLAATLLEEGANSPADVFYAQDPGGLGSVESLFQPLPAQTLQKSPAWAQSPSGLWVGVSGRARVLVYSTEAPRRSGPASRYVRPDRSEVEGTPGLGADQRFVPHDGYGYARTLGRGQDQGMDRGHGGERRGHLPQEHPASRCCRGGRDRYRTRQSLLPLPVHLRGRRGLPCQELPPFGGRPGRADYGLRRGSAQHLGEQGER